MRNEFLETEGSIFTSITTSPVLEQDGVSCFVAHVDRINENGMYNYATIQYPGLFILNNIGFSEEEILDIKKYVDDNSEMLWDVAREMVQEPAPEELLYV